MAKSKPRPSIGYHLFALVVIVFITFGMAMTAADPDRTVEAVTKKGKAAQGVLDPIAKALGPIGVVAVGLVLLAVAGFLLWRQLEARKRWDRAQTRR